MRDACDTIKFLLRYRGCTYEEIEDYFKDILEGTKEQKAAKLVLIGDGLIGKSTLLRNMTSLHEAFLVLYIQSSRI